MKNKWYKRAARDFAEKLVVLCLFVFNIFLLFFINYANLCGCVDSVMVESGIFLAELVLFHL